MNPVISPTWLSKVAAPIREEKKSQVGGFYRDTVQLTMNGVRMLPPSVRQPHALTIALKRSTLTNCNVGASVPDTEANGPNGQSIAEWRRKRGIDPSQQIRTVRLV